MIMTPRPNLNELSKQIVEANKLKGFHDKENSNEHYLSLVISELYEAVEADRKGRTFENESVCNDFDHFYRKESDLGFKTAFLEDIKDTVSDELADAIIRLLDLAGLRGWETEYEYNVHPGFFNNKSLTELIYDGVGILFDRALYPDDSSKILIKYIETLAYSLQIDIWRHVELKLKYNARREFKHGKEY